MRLYIAGHIIKHRETHWGRPWFEEASRLMKDYGHEVVNPLMVDDGFGGPAATARVFSKGFLLGLDIQVLSTCDGIVVSDDWNTSAGTRLEVFALLSLVGLQVFRIVPMDVGATPDGTILRGKGLNEVPPDEIAHGLLRVFETYPRETWPVLTRIGEERRFQDEKWGEQNHPDGTGTDLQRQQAVLARAECQVAAAEKAVTWALIKAEEAAEAFAEKDPEALTQELIEDAAVSVAWVEAIRRRKP